MNYQKGGPIFFYTGNDADIENFAKNSGILFDLTAIFNAGVVFAEHRYYDADATYSPLSDQPQNTMAQRAYLSTPQVLADYAQLLPYAFTTNFGVQPGDAQPQVIAIAGSYGAVLAAWMRLKYPNIISGAWISSGPVLSFHGGGMPLGAFDAVTTATMTASGCSLDVVRAGFAAIDNLGGSATTVDTLNTVFNISTASKLGANAQDIADLKSWVREGFESLATVNYPYPTGFFKPLPGWPMEQACSFLATAGADVTAAATQLYQAVAVFYGTGEWRACWVGWLGLDFVGKPIGRNTNSTRQLHLNNTLVNLTQTANYWVINQ